MNDHDLLVETHTMTRAIHKAVFGNGRPGLVQDVATLQFDMETRQAEARELRASVAAKRNNATLISAGMTTVLIFVAGIVRALGVPVPLP